MSCYHPLKAFPVGLTESGKTKYKVVSYNVDHIDIAHDKFIPSSVPIRSDFADRAVRDFITIPCGRCIGCRLDYSRDWANRLMLELQYHPNAYFVTLTYNDDHLPISYYADPETGEAIQCFTLRKRDIQLFMKRLRKRFGEGIRYFCAGEYGTNTFRPHYHLIIFNLSLDDLKVYKRSDQGFIYYNSDSLQSVWSIDGVPIGYAVVAPVTWETCAYTARYTTKKLANGDDDIYEKFNIQAPFSLMSRKPGIGREYYDDHAETIRDDYIYLATAKNGLKFQSPKYYNRLFDLQFPEKSDIIKKQKRLFAEISQQSKLANSQLSYLELLAVEEKYKEVAIKSLKRDDF